MVQEHHPKELVHGHYHIAEADYSEHLHSFQHREDERKKLLSVIALTGSMMIIEFIGGILTNSLALISDAGHMLTHSFALAVSYIAIIIASKSTNQERSFGLYRVEILAALFNGVTLIFISAYIFYQAYLRILNPQPIAELQMFIVALVGLLVNLVSALILSSSAKGDLNLKSAFLHMLADTFSSIAVVTGAITIYFTRWFIIDPLLSILICILILIWSWKLLNEAIHILLESTPRHIKIEEVVNSIKESVSEIKDVHDVHIWEITSRMYMMSAHVVINNMPLSDTSKLLNGISAILDHKFDIQHINVQFECENIQ
jgi:cobalt-zinc-cadmium efflux system protein